MHREQYGICMVSVCSMLESLTDALRNSLAIPYELAS